MNVDHVNVKIMATPESTVPWHELIPVFHRWIQERAAPELLIDVADYSHVPNGPGVMVIGHEAFYSVDFRAGQAGLLYNRRTPVEGSTDKKLRHAYDAALRAARRLESEPEMNGRLTFDSGRFEVFINDRLLAPNTRETFESLRPVVERVFEGSRLEWDSDARGLFRVSVSVSR